MLLFENKDLQGYKAHLKKTENTSRTNLFLRITYGIKTYNILYFPFRDLTGGQTGSQGLAFPCQIPRAKAGQPHNGSSDTHPRLTEAAAVHTLWKWHCVSVMLCFL